jgi:hypothetical protein
MSAKHSTHPTKTQRFWLDHIHKAKSKDQSLADYAKQHSLNLKAFYNYHSILRQKGLLTNTDKNESSFVAIETVDSSSRPGKTLTVVFPNGIRIEISDGNRHLSDILNKVQSL